MGIYARKSLRAGPFRMTLSKSGVNVSAGVKGFRVGSGPRGNYVRVGSGRLSYYASSGRGSSPSTAPRTPSHPVPTFGADIVMEDETGATILELATSSQGDLVTQIQDAAHRRSVWPWVLLLTVVLAGATGAFGAVVLVVGAVATWWIRQADRARQSVVVFYDLDDETTHRYERLHQAFGQATSTDKAWQEMASGALQTNYQRKVNAGATNLVDRKPARFRVGKPPILVTNIDVPCIDAAKRSVHLLPDMLLIREGRQYAQVAWTGIDVTTSVTKFIEDGAVPRDAIQLGTTWRYVNKSGGPDRRFKDNRQLPVLGYGAVTVSGPGGYRAEWQLSSQPATRELAVAFTSMSSPGS